MAIAKNVGPALQTDSQPPNPSSDTITPRTQQLQTSHAEQMPNSSTAQKATTPLVPKITSVLRSPRFRKLRRPSNVSSSLPPLSNATNTSSLDASTQTTSLNHNSIHDELHHHNHNLFLKLHPRDHNTRNPSDFTASGKNHQSNDPHDKHKRITDLAHMAASALQRRKEDQNSIVRYIAQLDVSDYMTQKSRVGLNTSMYVVLEGSQLSVSRTKNATAKYKVNVRVTPATVDVPLRELKIYVPSSEPPKVLRLCLDSEESAGKWKEALANALSSDIKEYYTFGNTIGTGAFGEVVKAVHNVTSDVRAIKIIKRGDGLKSKEHLDSEIEVMKSISHPNIIQTYQIFDLKRTIYIVMEYVSGGDLFDFVAQHDCLTEKQGSDTMDSILRAVEYLHCNSIVHRDLKPENILCVNESWPLQIKVSDFGFSNFLDPSTGEDDTMRTQVGTVYFMAPEILANKGHGPPVDLWACGVILYTILTGRLPFPGRNTTEYMSNVIKGKILFPTILWKGISNDAKSLVKGLLNLDPKKRLNSLGARRHRWIAWPDAAYGTNQIRRDRSNLHSRRRKLFKARKAIIAVAMANKFKATIPQVVDAVGDQTKKVAGAIENGVKKTADGIATSVIHISHGIEEGTKNIGENTKKVGAKVAGSTKKVAEGIGTGVKKTKDGVETGLKKTKDGVETGLKKTKDGVETGLKKTKDGMETGLKKTKDGMETGLKKTKDGVKKTKDGVKKTVDGVGQGVKKTADGIGHGVKKTADGIGHGVKHTGHAVKRGVGKIRHERSSRGTEDTRSQVAATEDEDGPATGINNEHGASGRRRVESHGTEEVENQENSSDVGGGTDDDGESSGGEDFQSAVEEHSETEEGWERSADRRKMEDDMDAIYKGMNLSPGKKPNKFAFTDRQVQGNGKRPALPPLNGLTMGLSDESMAGSSPREYRGNNRGGFGGRVGGFSTGLGGGTGLGSSGGGGGIISNSNNEEDSKQMDLLRKATAIMMS